MGIPSTLIHSWGYVIAAGLDESVPNAHRPVLNGRFVDLFDATLPVLTEVDLSPGKRALLYDLNGAGSQKPQIVAAACRIRNEQSEAGTLCFLAEGVAKANAVVRIATLRKPAAVLIGGKPAEQTQHNDTGSSLRLRFENSVECVPVEIRFVH